MVTTCIKAQEIETQAKENEAHRDACLSGLACPVNRPEITDHTLELHIPCRHTNDNVDPLVQSIKALLDTNQNIDRLEVLVESASGVKDLPREFYTDYLTAFANQGREAADQVIYARFAGTTLTAEAIEAAASSFAEKEFTALLAQGCYDFNQDRTEPISFLVSPIDLENSIKVEEIHTYNKLCGQSRRCLQTSLLSNPTTQPHVDLQQIVHMAKEIIAFDALIINPVRNQKMLDDIQGWDDARYPEEEGNTARVVIYGSDHLVISHERRELCEEGALAVKFLDSEVKNSFMAETDLYDGMLPSPQNVYSIPLAARLSSLPQDISIADGFAMATSMVDDTDALKYVFSTCVDLLNPEKAQGREQYLEERLRTYAIELSNPEDITEIMLNAVEASGKPEGECLLLSVGQELRKRMSREERVGLQDSIKARLKGEVQEPYSYFSKSQEVLKPQIVQLEEEVKPVLKGMLETVKGILFKKIF